MHEFTLYPRLEQVFHSEQHNLILVEFTKYTFYITIFTLAVAFVLKCIHYWKIYRKGTLSFKTIQNEFMQATNNSLAAYISKRTWIKVVFFFLGCYFIIVYPFCVYIVYSQGSQDADHQETTFLGKITYITISPGGNLLQMLLITLIGAKNQMILHKRSPLDTTILTYAEKSRFLRVNFWRAFAMLILIVYLPVIPQTLTGRGEGFLGDVFRNGVVLYYVFDRVSFLAYEKKTIKHRAIGAKITHKMLSIRKFVQDYTPETLVRAVISDDEIKVTTHQDMLKEMQLLMDSRVRILEQTLEMIEEDNSQPLLEMTGEIHIISKIFLLNTTVICVLLSLNVILEACGVTYDETWLVLPALFLHCYVSTIVLIPLFCTQMMLGFKEQDEDSVEIEAGWYVLHKNDSIVNSLKERLI